LSTIELRMLEGHLDGCPACRAFAETVSSATRLVRESDDEAPACSFDLRLARRHRVRRVAGVAARAGVAAAAIVAAFGVGLAVPERPGQAPDETAAPVFQPTALSLAAPNDGELLRLERVGNPHARMSAITRSFGAVL
jgi:hypothetical protein